MPRRTTLHQHMEESGPAGPRTARGKKFETSLDILCSLELSAQAVEFFMRTAYERRRLPHEIVRELIEKHVKRVEAMVTASWNSGHPV
jgi:hypothetical protein